MKSRDTQPAQARGREVARDAAHPEAVAAVGRELDLDHRPLEAQRLDRRRADLGVGGQLDDAVMLLAQLELAHRAEHADAGHAPITALFSTSPEAGMTEPSGANTAFMPVRALGAPQTTSKTPCLVSTVHRRSLSALGCWRASRT